MTHSSQPPLALSSLGLPGASLAEIIDVAREGRCEGLELRAVEGEAVHVGLSDAERARVRDRVQASGLQIATLASYVQVCDIGSSHSGDPVSTNLEGHIALAANLGATALRVFPGGDEDEAASDIRGRRRLHAAARRANSAGVRILLENHDSHPRAEDVLRVVSGTGAAVIWDPLHSWRAGEPFERSWSLLTPWLAEVQIKDVSSTNDLTPVFPGTGVLPLTQLAALIHMSAFDGWLCLEWEKAWYPEIPHVSIALAATNEWLGRHFSHGPTG